MEEAAPDARRPHPPSHVVQPHQHPPQPDCGGQQNPICPQFRSQAFAAEGQFRIVARCVHQGEDFRAGLSKGKVSAGLMAHVHAGLEPDVLGQGFGSYQLKHKETSEGWTGLSCVDAPSFFFSGSPNQIFSEGDDVTVTVL